MTAPPTTRWIYEFDAGSRDMRELLGGKGANIAEMARILPAGLVPAGFTVTTEACVRYLRDGRVMPTGLAGQLEASLERLEERAGAGSATPATRCSSRCAAARVTRCPA